MQRLIRIARRLPYKGRLLKKTLIAQWNPVDLKNDNILQILTDAMTYNSNIQINYKGSGWRNIRPYGWNSSKTGNILLMSYKDTGEIRSYRIDRINDLLVNDSLLEAIPKDRPNEPLQFQDFQIPQLPNLDQIIEETENESGDDTPYSEGLKALRENEVPVDFVPEQELKDGEDLDEIADDSNDESIENEENVNDTENEEENEDEDSDFNWDDLDLDELDDFANDEDKDEENEEETDDKDDEK